MKLLLLLLTLTTLTACNQERNRLSSCKDGNGKSIQCATTNGLSADNFRKMYIAEVEVPVKIGVVNFLLNGTAKRGDSDNEYNCELDVAAGTQFNYVLKDKTLTLTNGITSLIFTKTDGQDADGFLGTWAMVEDSTKVQLVTELIFNDLSEVRMRKTCSLR